MTAERRTFALRCEACEALFDHGNAGPPAYECSRCGQAFASDDDRRCPNCGIFAAKAAAFSCPDCDSTEIEEGEFPEPLPPTAEELAEDAARRRRSDARLAEQMAASALARAARRERWTALAPAFAGITDSDGQDLSVTLLSVLGGGSLSCDLRIGEAEAIAWRILSRDPASATAPEHSSDRREAISARHAAQRTRWDEPDGPARAFAGLPATTVDGSPAGDLSELLRGAFGSQFGAVGLGLETVAWEAMAVRLCETASTPPRPQAPITTDPRTQTKVTT